MTKESDTESRSIIKSSSQFGLTTQVSRVSGFMRDILFANYFGASSSTDAFFVAFKIPNFFRRLFAEGAFLHSNREPLRKLSWQREISSLFLKTKISSLFQISSLLQQKV